MGTTPLLRIRELATAFRTGEGEIRAVDRVSFSLDEGEALGLVGESGCGKTVTALSILGLVGASGRILPGSSIRFRGEELVEASPRRLRRVRGGGVAMIFQEPMSSLNPVYTVGEQIGEVLRLHRGLRGAEARAEAAELLGEVGIAAPEQRLSAHPHELSGGMRQRVMIAVALAGDPAVLVADEPTTALDVTIQAQILDLLDRLRRDRGMAVLLITHDLAVVAEMCDRVAVMYAGQIVETGTPRRIYERPTHPYTRGLLGSLPRIGAREGPLCPIPGTVPDPADRPEGCRFRDRCPHAWRRCRNAPPLLDVVGTGRPGAARCWLVDEPDRRGEGAPPTNAGPGRKPDRGADE